MAETYSDDTPLKNSTDDRFHRWPFAQRVAETIAARKDPSSIVIAIFGAWGDGKSTVLNFIEEALSAQDRVIVLRYNPWRFGNEDDLLAGFFDTLAQTLSQELKSKSEKLRGQLRKYAGMLKAIPTVGSAAASAAADYDGPSLEQLRERIEKLLSKADRRICVLVDDIDRLERAEIYSVFRLVKLTADFANVAYVLTFDKDLVAASLGERYGAGDRVAGAAFLEKIVQVPLDLPPAGSAALIEYCYGCINEALATAKIELTSDESQDVALRIHRYFESCLRTPRLCKRFGNALAFALPILRGEVNVVDQITVEGLRVFYPAVHQIFRDNKDRIFSAATDRRSQEQKRWVNAALAPIFEGRSADEVANIKNLLCELLPVIAHALGGTAYGDGFAARWRRERRATSLEYFDRYFRYAIPEGDVPDAAIGEIIESADTLSVSDIAARLAGLLSQYSAQPVIQKLRSLEKTLSTEVSVRLAQAVSQVGPELPRPPSFLGVDTPFEQASILVGNLLGRIGDVDQRRSVTSRLIQESASISWAIYLFRWCREFKDTPEYDQLVEEANTVEYGSIIAAGIEKRAATVAIDLIAELGTDLSSSLWIWNKYGQADQFRHYWEGAFSRDARNAARLLLAYNPASWLMESGKRVRGHFQREQYDALVNLFDPASIMIPLRSLYGTALDSPRGQYDQFTDDLEYVSHQFCKIHAIATSQQPKVPNGEAESPSASTPPLLSAPPVVN